MCLAIPGKVVSLRNSIAIIDCLTEKKEAIVKGIAVKPGDYVLVQFGMVAQKLSEKDASEAIRNWKELNSQPE